MLAIVLLTFFLLFHPVEQNATFLKFQAEENPKIPNRLLDPSYDESIAHILLNPFRHVNPGAEDQMQNATELVELCRKIRDDEPVLFPRFLCALLYVYQEENKPALPHTRELFTEYSEAILFLNDPLNYPCHSFFGKLDVVAFAPSRIFSGCIDDLDPKNNSTLSHAFVMTHPFPEMKMCTEIGKRARCELRSMMVQDAMLFQEEDCCCDSGDCVILVFTQVKSLTPIIIKRVDLRAESLIPLRKETTPIVSINAKTTATTKPRKTP